MPDKLITSPIIIDCDCGIYSIQERQNYTTVIVSVAGVHVNLRASKASAKQLIKEVMKQKRWQANTRFGY